MPMVETGEQPQPDVKLHCCHGAPAPPSVVAGWRRFLLFPPEARQAFWNVLGPALFNPLYANRVEVLEPYCRQHGIATDDALSAIHSAGFLISNACAGNLGVDTLRRDLLALSNGDTKAAEVITDQYESAKVELRKRMTRQSLLDHGKLLLGLDWRVDEIAASSRGADLRTTVIFLTLRYQEGLETEQISLQLTPDALRDLKLFMQRFGESAG